MAEDSTEVTTIPPTYSDDEPFTDDGDDGEETDPVPVHPIPTDPGKLPQNFPPEGTDRNGLGVAQFLVELVEPVTADDVQRGSSAEYVVAKGLALPLNEVQGTFLIGAVAEKTEGTTGTTKFTITVVAQMDVVAGNLIILLVKAKANLLGAPWQVGVALGKLEPLI